MEGMNILITGGCGFIGSNIAKNLCLKNKVRILDNLSTGNINNIKDLNVEYIWGDITNLETCRAAVKGIDVICHQAALGSVPRSILDPLSTHNANVNGFLNILISAKEQGIKRIVYASSSSVYGDNNTLPKTEENIGEQLSSYAVSKHINELYAKVFSKNYGMECIGLRYFNIFGPNQNPNGVYAAVIPKFINLMLNDEQPTINGDGLYSRDFTFVDNAVSANILALTTTNNKAFGKIFNIGNEGRVSINDLIESINGNLNKNIKPKYINVRAGDIPHSNANIDKAKNILGYVPLVDFDTGIKRTIKFLQF